MVVKVYSANDDKIAIECDRCGKVYNFSKIYFSSITKDGCVPNVLIQCPNCKNQTPAGSFIAGNATGQIDTTPRCPKCGSSAIQVVRGGFNAGGAMGTGLLFGPLAGLIVGAAGTNKVSRVCMNCGHKF